MSTNFLTKQPYFFNNDSKIPNEILLGSKVWLFCEKTCRDREGLQETKVLKIKCQILSFEPQTT